MNFDTVTTLTDKQATTMNIKIELTKLISEAHPNDTIVFTYSGHGSQVPDKDADEIDKLDEILCPTDLNWTQNMIVDDYLYNLFLKVPDDVQLLVLSDSCHSGSLLRVVKPPAVGDENYRAPRYLTPPARILKKIDKIKSAIYANDAQNAGIAKPSKKEDFNSRKGILISGCQSDQTSSDAFIDGKPQGAFTAMLWNALESSDFKITYSDLNKKINELLDKKGYEQNPQLECPDIWKDKLFLA
jgi:hypothetical protein